MNVARPTTCLRSRRSRGFPGFSRPGMGVVAATGWLVLAGLLAAAEVGPYGLPPAPSLVPLPAASLPQDDLVARAVVLEQQQRWSDVVSICESAARKGPLPVELQRRYDLAKIHCDISRRHGEQAFRSQLARLTEADARRVYAEVLSRIASHHVEAPQFGRLVARGCLAMDLAIEDPAFAAAYAAQATPERLAHYREQVERIRGGRTVGSQVEAETVAAWIARAAHSSLGIPPAVTLLEMTAAAMGGLDEYSAFLTNGQLDDLYAQIEGNFVGLGIELKSAADGLLVVHVIPGSPAERAGIRAGDHVVGVGGRSIGGMNVDEAAQLLQGPEGSLVTLAILRAPAPARAVTVRREHVEVPSVENVRMLDPASGVSYLKISSFQKTTAADLEAALRRLDASGMRSLIIDLRGNPGGLLSAAVDVADLFLERGLVVATRGRSPEEDFNYSATRAGTWRMPLVVIIDGDSASSSEIFAGAIRDHARGTIVGTRSYGKGSIQGIFPLEVGGVGMRLTTAKFFSPNGHPYSRVGVEPHLQVHAAARPVGGERSLHTVAASTSATVGDAFVETAVEAARRATPRPTPRPAVRTTVAR
ncbi:MAG: S41 family peptidase [Planctomycetia bacterium]|nr:S41 family peptidase [Planctomycetia bacterium]